MAQIDAKSVTYRRVAAIALPVVLSNATVPLQGAVDTAVIGNLGNEVYLAAVVLAASAVAILLALFNFLQFGTSALGAQALGAGDNRRVINVLARGLIISAGLAVLLIAIQSLLFPAVMLIFEGSEEAEDLAILYLSIRIWAAPAELAVFAISGWFAGQEMTRRLFELQLVTSITNIVLNVFFVLGLGMDVDGVALGTLIAAWVGLGVGLWRVRQRMHQLMPDWRPERARLLNPEELGRLMRLNRDIFIRTILLIGSFAYMTRLGSQQGDTVLAANGILYQIYHVASYGLDGVAIAVEALVGQAVGARDRATLRRATIVSTVSAFCLAFAFAAVLLILQAPLLSMFTNIDAVRDVAHQYYFYAALFPVVAVLAYQLDGVFVGATQTAAMRNAMIVSAGLYFAVSGWGAETYGNHGVWLGIWVFLVLRAVTLIVQYPRLEARAAA